MSQEIFTKSINRVILLSIVLPGVSLTIRSVLKKQLFLPGEIFYETL